MNKSTVQNTETPFAETPELNDRDLISDALATEKQLCSSYGTATQEASHDALYQMIFSQLRDISKQQRNFYELQFKHGWYALTPADSKGIQETVQQYQGYKQQLQ